MNFKGLKIPICLCLLFAFSLNPLTAFAQNALDDIEEEDRTDSTISSEQAPKLVTETIKNISSSKKIFAISNENQSFSKGDFISLLLANKLVCRALVAKSSPEKISGIKIVKIYDLALWKQLAPGKEVLILKGDDSFYTNKATTPDMANSLKDKKNESKIQNDEDLFNSTSISGSEDDTSLEENSLRLIKPDNLLSLNVGIIQAKDVDGSKANYTHVNGDYSYQLIDNLWAEVGTGYNIISDYPFTSLDTQLISVGLKVKYTIIAPFYSYIQPYIGYQTILASSPGAGADPGDGSRSAADLAHEVKLVQDLKKSSLIFGATILKRLVPGWFFRADFGTDIINGGLTIEF
jgi:hypothetical protein